MSIVTTLTTIRPSGRIIATIGEDLIGDAYAALVELVKNAYDADATKIDIWFDYVKVQEKEVLKIEISDDGHGMSKNVVLDAWLVPATKDKLERIESPKGRPYQGKKGIGRYAAAILGDELIMKTVDKTGEKTEVFINWSKFKEARFLDNVEILVATDTTTENSGTTLFITAVNEKRDQWGRNQLYSLTNELRKLKSPFKNHGTDDFTINLAFTNCPFEEYNNQSFEIEAFPIIDLFDYRIHGSISESGELNATYENKTEPSLAVDTINRRIKFEHGETYCGPVEFDFRVFDRDYLDNIIDKGLIDPISKLSVGKREAKRLLDEVYGVNLYRAVFRIRPYGNGGIDWLDLDKDRIQNPSRKVGNNQVVGFVNVKPEKLSNLEEKSARDGLKENTAYFGLKTQLKEALSELETRRFEFRLQIGRGRKKKNIQQEVETLFDYSTLVSEVSNKLSHLQIANNSITEIATIIYKDAERKSKILENIQNTIAVYQGQATLGKIVTILIHEGRKSVNYFRQQSANLSRWLEHYKAKGNWEDDLYYDILDRLRHYIQLSESLSELFKRIDPLSKQSRGERREFNIEKTILKTFHIFENQLHERNIEYFIDCSADLTIIGWEEDLIIALTNLMENSIYWLSLDEMPSKNITINVTDGKDIVIHFRDNGPGISKTNIESGVIFEPGFSKKLNGTGLGLPIAGEAIERLGGTITAHHSDEGAYFIIELKK